MTKTIAKKDLYRQLKAVSDDVVKNGAVYTVFQNSKPAFHIVPMFLNLCFRVRIRRKGTWLLITRSFCIIKL